MGKLRRIRIRRLIIIGNSTSRGIVMIAEQQEEQNTKNNVNIMNTNKTYKNRTKKTNSNN